MCQTHSAQRADSASSASARDALEFRWRGGARVTPRTQQRKKKDSVFGAAEEQAVKTTSRHRREMLTSDLLLIRIMHRPTSGYDSDFYFLFFSVCFLV